MELTVTPKAQKWFESEIDLPETYGIRFFGKVYGKTEVHDGFRLGCQWNSLNILSRKWK